MFKTEKDLVSCIQKKFTYQQFDLLDGDKQSVFTELNLGYGIADMVLVGHKKNYPKRKKFLGYFDISLLNIIKKEKVTFEDIVYLTKSPSKKIHSSLKSLIGEGFIIYREGHYFSHKKYANILTDSIAIEAKLKDWKHALKQAYRYKWFANKSFVFLPSENLSIPKKNIDLFKKYNVGLAGVSKKNGVEVIYEPTSETPISEKMKIALNEHLLFNNNF